MTYRARYDRQLPLPPALPGCVRYGEGDDSTVHQVHTSFLDPSGKAYLTVCNDVLVAADRAILTTRPADCSRCLRGGR